MRGNEPVVYCRADKGKWKQVSGWMRESGGQVESGNEQVWGMWLEGGTERQNVIGALYQFYTWRSVFVAMMLISYPSPVETVCLLWLWRKL